jgi:hypothetical protein
MDDQYTNKIMDYYREELYMKLTWKDIVTTLLAAGGAALVWAKFYEYNWAVVGSWRSAVAVLAGLGLGMCIFSNYQAEFRNRVDTGEMVLGIAAAVMAVVGMVVTSSIIFYALAGVIGTLWLVSTFRHVWHSLTGTTGASYHRQVMVH